LERIEAIERSKDIHDAAEREAVLGPQRKAQEVFRGLLEPSE
jgi:hypothetical protein